MNHFLAALLFACALLLAVNCAKLRDSEDKVIEALTPELLKDVTGDNAEKFSLKKIKTEDPYANISEAERPLGVVRFNLYFDALPKSGSNAVPIKGCKTLLSVIVYPRAEWKVEQPPVCFKN